VVKLRAIPDQVIGGVKRFNAKLFPPARYVDTLMLGLSTLEEAYFLTKTVIDGTIHVSEKVLYEDQYHEQRIKEYRGQQRLVVFVPGYMQTHACFYRLEHYLGIDLFDAFTYTWSDFPYSQDITLSADQLGSVLRDLTKRLAVKEIYLVGHSQGGLVIRSLVQHGSHPELPIRKCLFLSSPHQGTWIGMAALPHRPLRLFAGMLPYIRKVIGESGTQLIPGSDFIKQLNARPLPSHIKFVSVYYAFDPLIWPTTNAILPYPEAENYFVHKIGHAQSLYCSRATRIAIRALYSDKANPSSIQDAGNQQ
jgi:pimeloyl-ACP methyl ester carboxylesterase